MSEARVVIKRFQGVWVASIFHLEITEHRGFVTQQEAEEHGRKRAQQLQGRPTSPDA
ncbi:hypothetical protein QO002_000827 [Pararhizobium capsulatum DSM 1112]|uniref:DUF2188 domain-containing protein n=1 Tax=Pararhizobium capsulatum DSM 1112 TaxID=1121113 RepID=A0ABU0BKA6_9HYPH|nr:hypothetical protein [Pararhizobium capsulatum DSM 1112]